MDNTNNNAHMNFKVHYIHIVKWNFDGWYSKNHASSLFQMKQMRSLSSSPSQ